MPEAPPHPREAERLQALRALGILDTEPEERFERFVRLGCAVTGCPVALVSLVDEKRQWFKAKLGIEACETGRDESFCAYVVHQDEPLVIEDATTDPRVADMAIVTDPPKIRAYAGIPIRDHRGFPLGSFCVVDFQPRRFPEETIALLKDLARSVENEISNYELNALTRELVAEKQRVEEANRAKSDFLAFMSHEIRTPLNGVLSIADHLLKSSLLPRQERMARIIRSSGDLMLILINDILDFSKLEAGALQLDPQPIDPKNWALEVTELFSFSISDKEIDFVQEISPELPPLIEIDPLRCKQIATNLLSNALKFTAQGTITFRLFTSGGVILVLEVEDTGVGIPVERQAKLFQPYQQADPSVYRTHGGTGLGLSICKQLAELMGGGIALESEPGRGSRFTVSVPLIEARRPADEPGSNGGKVKTFDRNIDLLVIEDNPINRQVIQYLLQKLPVQLIEATSGKEGLEIIRSGQSVDAVLLDLRLDDQSGYQVARSIREWEQKHRRQPIRIIAHSADFDPETRELCQSAGMNGFVPKPVNPDELRASLLREN